jgi:predicted nucleic acid-binding Zn finger protein
MYVSSMTLPLQEVTRLSKNQLDQDDIEYFRIKYGKRFVRAFRAVEEGKVTRYLFRPSESGTWIVHGRERDYLVIPDTFCTCRDFYQSVVINRETEMCYHLLAQTIASIRNEQKTVETTDADRRKLYLEWRRIP